MQKSATAKHRHISQTGAVDYSLSLSPNRIQRESLASIVYAHLKNALAEGKLMPGQKLTGRELCEQLGVSQTPVREAMLQLVAERALTLNPNRSITVPELTRDKFIELRDMRVALEGLAAAHAAAVATADQVDEIASFHDKLMRAKRARAYGDTMKLNRLLHFAVYELSGREELISLIESLWARTGPYLNFLYRHQEPAIIDPHPHEALIAALRSNQSDDARKAIEVDIIQGGCQYP
ncbi:MAG: GntR family transcriptional regulator [Burkholderiaceae bacterium]|nr:GntR family transcriptional regulator [Burkholderiaceae bacterium]